MLTQEQYTLFTGQTLCNFSNEDWELIVNIAEMRLASFLCLEELPDTENGANQDFLLLLANFVCAALKFQGTPELVESKSVRNFTINFKSSATNAFDQIFSQYEDIIEKYSKCGHEVKVERSDRHCCGYYNNGYFNF